MDKIMKIAVILTATDRMTKVISAATGKAQKAMQALQNTGVAAMAAGAGTAALMAGPIKAFADLEDAGLRLKSVLLKDGGIIDIKQFDALNKQAIDLGNKLPGTTADFQNLYATMLEQGTPAKAILEGTGKAAAYLAVQLKMPTEEAGKMASRLRLQLGIADNEMMQFMDVMSRIKNVGVDPLEMQYAFGRSAGAMKLLNIQGLQASKTMGILYAMLIREGGATGETAGTGISKILNETLNPVKMEKFNKAAAAVGLSFKFFDKGKFLGMENVIAQLNQFQGMDPEKISRVLLPLTGGEGMDNQFIAALSKMGVQGFNKMSREVADQATIWDKVAIILKSLNSKLEAAQGNISNAAAAFAQAMVPALKEAIDFIAELSVKIQKFIEAHPTLTKWIAISTASFASLAIIGGTVSLAISGLTPIVSLAALAIKGLWFATLSVIPTLGNLHKLLLFTTNIINGAYAGIVVFATFMKATLWPALVQATTASWAFTMSLLANPITWVVIGIAALVAGLILAYKHFEKFRAFIDGLVSLAIEFYMIWKEIFQKIAIGFVKIMSGDMIGGFKDMASALVKANPIGLAITEGKRLGDAYNAGYKSSLAISAAAKISSNAANPKFNVFSNAAWPGTNLANMQSPLRQSPPVPTKSTNGVSNFNMTFNITGAVNRQMLGDLGKEFEDRMREVIRKEKKNELRRSF